MGRLPAEVEELLNAALVSELTVLDDDGRPVTYPLIPLYDGDKIFMTSSVLFSKKLEHIKRNPRVSMTITDPVGTQVESFGRVTIQGDARVIEDDLHSGWEREVLHLWAAKEPIINKLVKQRFAMPLFWERAVIEITPRRILLWPGGLTQKEPRSFEVGTAA
ncbi:MAG: pyridoxamine 5'-phosphate oxidase family protein [Actinomycetota bacterium]|jgi:nitroimidazol reductase NimA-like FMN-containing flavoprotein (pyridoxamine 5'-phosphate oxidase superfamily)